MDVFELTKPLVDALKGQGLEWPPAGKNTFQRIRFKDGRWGNLELLLGECGAIFTYEQLTNWEETLAHMKPDGTIARYGRQIGHRDLNVWIWWPLQLEEHLQ